MKKKTNENIRTEINIEIKEKLKALAQQLIEGNRGSELKDITIEIIHYKHA